MVNSKKCFKCESIKPLSEFYKHKKMADGHLNKCKACAKKDFMETRYRNLSDYLEYDNVGGAKDELECYDLAMQDLFERGE